MAESEFIQILRERVIRPAALLDLQRAKLMAALQIEVTQCRRDCSDSNSAPCIEACERTADSCIAQVGAQYAVPVARFHSCLAACKTGGTEMECVTRCVKYFDAHCQSCQQVVKRIAQTCRRNS